MHAIIYSEAASSALLGGLFGKRRLASSSHCATSCSGVQPPRANATIIITIASLLVMTTFRTCDADPTFLWYYLDARHSVAQTQPAPIVFLIVLHHPRSTHPPSAAFCCRA